MADPFLPGVLDFSDASALFGSPFQPQSGFPRPSTLNPSAPLEDILKRAREFLGEKEPEEGPSAAVRLAEQQGGGAAPIRLLTGFTPGAAVERPTPPTAIIPPPPPTSTADQLARPKDYVPPNAIPNVPPRETVPPPTRLEGTPPPPPPEDPTKPPPFQPGPPPPPLAPPPIDQPTLPTPPGGTGVSPINILSGAATLIDLINKGRNLVNELTGASGASGSAGIPSLPPPGGTTGATATAGGTPVSLFTTGTPTSPIGTLDNPTPTSVPPLSGPSGPTLGVPPVEGPGITSLPIPNLPGAGTGVVATAGGTPVNLYGTPTTSLGTLENPTATTIPGPPTTFGGPPTGEAATSFFNNNQGLISTAQEVAPWLSAAFNIYNNATGNAPDWQKAVNSAVDIAAAALAVPTLGLSSVAAPVVKQDIGTTIGTFSNWDNTNTGQKIAAVNPDPVFRITNDILSMLGYDMFGPSKAWKEFPSKIGASGSFFDQQLTDLAQSIQASRTPQDIANLVAQYKQNIATGAGAPGGYKGASGYGVGSGPYDLPELPASYGKVHGVKIPAPPPEQDPNNVRRVVQGLIQGTLASEDYRDLLGRAPTAQEIAPWIGQSPDATRGSIASSPERAQRVGDLYKWFLGREGQPSEASGYGTQSIADIVKGMQASPERLSDISRLYQTELGRPGTAPEWTPYAQSMQSLAQIQKGIQASPEGVQYAARPPIPYTAPETPPLPTPSPTPPPMPMPAPSPAPVPTPPPTPSPAPLRPSGAPPDLAARLLAMGLDPATVQAMIASWQPVSNVVGAPG